jgi:hypothetical protein
MRTRDRILLFLYSTPNIVGSLLGLAGLLLFFLGVIQDFWLFIVVGLYLIGVLVTPKQTAYDLSIQTQVSAEEIRAQLDALVRKIRKRMPAEVLAKIESIKASIDSILPILAASNLGDRNVFTIRQTVFEYLPTALENYLSLPPAFANLHPVRDGKTARQLLNEQLDILDREMKEIVVDMSANDTQKLLAHGRFLEQKFNQADFLGDLLGKKPGLAAPTAQA